jgi:hypothetical protein
LHSTYLFDVYLVHVQYHSFLLLFYKNLEGILRGFTRKKLRG